jgi:predicted amidohydrolase
VSYWNKLKEKAFLQYLCWKTRPTLIRRYLDGKGIRPAGTLRTINTRRVRAAAVQAELRLVQDPLAYVEQMYHHVRTATDRGAQLVVFPEDNATHLLGLLPGLKDLPAGATLTGALHQLGPDVKVADIFAYLTPVSRSVYFTTFAELARRFEIFIMAGSIVAANDQGRVTNTAYLFGPDGQLVGVQEKLHLLPLESEWGLAPGSELLVYSSPLGKLAMPVCMDATYFETFRLLSLMGAEVVMLPSADVVYTHWKALRGIWPRVQESLVYGIKSTLVAHDFFGLNLAGRSCICAPMELTPKGDGMLAEAQSHDKEEVVVADLDLEALRDIRTSSRLWGDLNLALYQHYLPGIYGASRGRFLTC